MRPEAKTAKGQPIADGIYRDHVNGKISCKKAPLKFQDFLLYSMTQ